MKELRRFRGLSDKDKALVAVAVLLDGGEATTYLATDSLNADALVAAATSVAELPPEMRMPYLGTVLRMALSELGHGG